MQEHEVASAVHSALSHEGEAAHAAHELPNFITVLTHLFPDSPLSSFLHQWENVLFSLMAAAVVCAVPILALKRQKLIPEGLQNFCETVAEGVENFVCGILGPDGRKYVPFLGTLFVYILLMNWSGLIPLMKSPTSSWGTTIAVSLATLFYVQFTGIREQGLWHYLKHMAGNPTNLFGLALIPLMLVINLSVEFVAVPLSLSLRLFANVSSEDRLLFKFAELNVLFKGLPFFFQLFANILAIAFSVVQAFVFMLLSTVYISLILPHEPHEHAAHKHGGVHAHA